MNYWVKLLLLFLALSGSSYAKTIEINMMSISEVELKDLIIYESSILDYFWSGNDGVECGDPTLDKLTIDYKNKLIKFTVIPAAQAYSCEVRSMACELGFQTKGSGFIHIMDKPAYLFDQCSL